MHSYKFIPFVIAALAACAMGAGQPQRRLFDYERRVGDTRPKPDLNPNPFPKREGAGVGSDPSPSLSPLRREARKSPGWQPNGIIVADTANCILPKIVTDGNSGAIICWTEKYRGADSVNHYSDDIYAQSVDSGGNFVWPSQGIPVCSLSGSWSNYPAMISDGKGGAIIAWEDDRGGVGYTRVFAQRLDSLGNRLWAENGVLVCNQMSGYVDICSDGHGGAIIAYVDGRDEATTSDNIYAQRIDSTGNAAWTIDGVPVCTADNIQFRPHICVNNKNGAIITWEDDYRNNSTTGEDVYAQMIDSLRNYQWDLNGKPICIQPGMQKPFKPINNSYGGGNIGWVNIDSTYYFVNSVDSFGINIWDSSGVRTTIYGLICSDSRGGCLISSSNIANRVDSLGNVCWGTGVPFHSGFIGGRYDISEDLLGGVIIIWDDSRNNPSFLDQYIQRVDSSGNLLWNATGVPVCTLHVSAESYPKITYDGLGGALCAWFGWYPGSKYLPYMDVIAQRIHSDGTPGGVSGKPQNEIIIQTSIHQVYPNPFMQSLAITYQLTQEDEVQIAIYNIAGQKVWSRKEPAQARGLHAIHWDGRDQTGKATGSGVYLLRMSTGNTHLTTKLVKVK